MTRGFDHLCNELSVLNRLSTLHDAHDRCLGFIVSICSHSLMSGLVLFLGLFQLNLIDLDAHLCITESGVVREDVSRLNFLALGRLRQNAVFGAREGLQSPL